MSEVKKEVSAVDWLIDELFVKHDLPIDKESNPALFNLLEQAKKMFEQQIENAFNAGFDDGCGFTEDMKYKDGEKYYNETYGKKNKQ
jgi:hypothetical protein